jgi:hypothetical protein
MQRGNAVDAPREINQPQMNRIALLLCEPERTNQTAVALIFSVGDLFNFFPAMIFVHRE